MRRPATRFARVTRCGASRRAFSSRGRGLEVASILARGVEATEGSEKCQNARKGPETKGFGGISIHGALTVSGAASYLFKLVSKRSTTMNRAGRNEADIQAAQPQAGQQARVPGAQPRARPYNARQWILPTI